MIILKKSYFFIILLFVIIITYIFFLEEKIDALNQEIEQLSIERVKTLTITAYSNSIAETDSTPNITASNKKIKPGYVAVSRDLFYDGWTFGKKIYIDQIGIYQIEDLMNKKHKERIDIFIGNKKKAKEFGIEERKVVLLN